MRRIVHGLWPWLAAAFIFMAAVGWAGDGDTVIAITGAVPTPERYTLEQLQKLGSTNVTARDHDGTNAEFTGLPLETLLRRAGAPMGEALRGKALMTAVVVHAADQYQAVFSLAELESTMVAQPALLAWSRNGQGLAPTQGPLRLIVPGDKRQARWVRQVTAVEVVAVVRPAITNASTADRP